MNPGRFAVKTVVAAVVLYLSVSMYASGHGGGGGGGGFSGGGGGGHGGSSASGHGGPGPGARGYSVGPGGRYSMRGYPGIYGAGVRGRMMPPYVPPTVQRSGAIHSSRPIAQTGTNSQLSRSATNPGNRSRVSSPQNSGRQGLKHANTSVNGSGTPAVQSQGNRGQKLDTVTGTRRGAANHKGLDPQTRERLRNWQGPRADLSTARQRHRDWSHGHHGHDWWRHHCDVIIFDDWGWWGWWDGWWFPAWGYDPYYSEYAYDGPIYGYNGLPPDEAVAGVQQELQRLGYYTYAVDGQLGPQTQAAINRYQRDHRLPITGTIDPATVSSLNFPQ